jgi:tripartite-type tricarboxylate transporter receptor subunit TctC
MSESGYPDIAGDSWIGVLVPAGTPKEIIATLHREIAQIVALSDMRERLVTLGYEPVASTPEEFAQFIKAELAVWGRVIRTANIKLQ